MYSPSTGISVSATDTSTNIWKGACPPLGETAKDCEKVPGSKKVNGLLGYATQLKHDRGSVAVNGS
jgi:hypothetical protein